MLFDISPPISPALKVWPGDTPVSREILQDIDRGDNLTLCTLHSTVHAGAHADAPSHYSSDGASIGEQSLDYYLGPCQVMRVDTARSDLLGSAALPATVTTARVLFATGTFPDPTIFNEDFAAFAPELIDHLHERGVRLVGIDTPSVDPFASKDLPVHRRCLAHDMAILEGLCLDAVPAGVYELIALPLPLMGFDASPVRAVLRTLDATTGAG